MEKINKTVGFFAFALMLLVSGCTGSGGSVLDVLASPTRHETKVPAEFPLVQKETKQEPKILVLVDQPGWMQTPVNMRLYLTKAVNDSLQQRVKIDADNLISYKELSSFRSEQTDFQMLKPAEVGKALNADIVLFITLSEFTLKNVEDAGLFSGSIQGQASLFDVASSNRLWPQSDSGKTIKVGYEIGYRGQLIAVGRLSAAFAHCVTRSFYDCPLDEYSIAEDRSGQGWSNW